jgi:hypothetical protein
MALHLQTEPLTAANLLGEGLALWPDRRAFTSDREE